MTEWKEYKLGELIKTNVKSIGRDYPYSKILYLDTGSITCNNIDSFQEFELDKAPSRAKRLVKQDDIIYSSVRPNQLHYGYITNPQDNLVVSTGFVTITCNKDLLCPKFLYYFLIQSQITEYLHSVAEASTSAYPSLKPSDIEALDIEIPPLDTQRRIASILSSLDDKIDLLHRENATLEQMAETMFRQWFVEESKEEWEEVLITELFEVKDGTHDSPKPQEYGHKLITSKYIHNNSIDLNEAYNISDTDFTNINKRSKVDTNDILFSMIGTIGLIYLEQNEIIDYAIKNVGLIKTSQNPNWKYFVYLWFKSELGLEWIHENKTGSTQEYISLNSLRSIKFRIKDLKQVQEFDQTVNIYFEKLRTNKQQIRTLIQTRDGLLPRLMSGEIKI